MFWCKIFFSKKDLVAAICDEELLGKRINLKEKKLKIEISKNFYGGKLIGEKVALGVMKRATIGNLMGKEIVELANQNGFIIMENVIFINGIPHAQFVKI